MRENNVPGRLLPTVLIAGLIAALLLIALAPTASAHVQVRPSEVAADEAVLWTVLVPNEQKAETTAVEVEVPEGVTPFSYADTPGWKRELNVGPDGSVRSIKWTGSLSRHGLGLFTFLASAPSEPGEIHWKAIQTYSNGDVVRWIGGPDSEHPASVSTVTPAAEPQGAGGAHRESTDPVTSTGSADSAAANASEDDDGGSTATVISIIALVVALVGLGVAYLGRRRS